MQEMLVASSTSHTQQTALSQRVQRWQETLQSELARQVDVPPCVTADQLISLCV